MQWHLKNTCVKDFKFTSISICGNFYWSQIKKQILLVYVNIFYIFKMSLERKIFWGIRLVCFYPSFHKWKRKCLHKTSCMMLNVGSWRFKWSSVLKEMFKRKMNISSFSTAMFHVLMCTMEIFLHYWFLFYKIKNHQHDKNK